MSQPEIKTPASPPRRKRWGLKILIGFGLLGGLLVLSLAVGYILLIRAAEESLRDAMAEADRLDPGWRLEELEAKRQADEIPVEEDAAARVLSVLELIPEDWQSSKPEVKEPRG
jgi:hypothetical protein